MFSSTASHPDRTVDEVSAVLEQDAVVAGALAERLVRIDRLREHAVTEAIQYGRGTVQIAERSARLELAAAARISENAAGLLLVQAEALVHRYEAVLASLRSARITSEHAEIYVRYVDRVEPELRDQVVGPALELAEAHPVNTFRRMLQALVETVRAQTLTERHHEALQDRRVVVEPAEDGMAWLLAHLPAPEAHAIHGRLTGQAKVITGQEAETRTLGQVRADILGDLLMDSVADTLPPEARGIRPTSVVTVPVLSLKDDEAAAKAPAVVEGVGPIPIHRARELCGSAQGWMRVLTHPETGMVLSVGRDRYRPPPSLRKLVAWRADRCMAPGCNIPASKCQIDHTLAWEHGGTTALSNHAPLCQGHHTIKHHGGWKVEQVPDSGGALHWTSPAGRCYTVEPERRVPVFTPAPDHEHEVAPAPF